MWKDPQQHDVTASAIWIGQRGNKKVGNSAYHSAQTSPEYGIRHFKRFIGSDTKLQVKGRGEEWTPEQCSAEILRELYSYIPAEIQAECVGTVVTVPAAFDQSQKNATLDAAKSAGIGQVTLLQEPVAALMAATRGRTEPCHIVIYDIGGGTLDVAIGEWTSKGIILHSHGGVAMLGGRDIDRIIRKKIIEPWLESTFYLPENWQSEDAWSGTSRLCDYAAEQAKIRLSREDRTAISMEEREICAQDAKGAAMYLDVPIGREHLDEAISGMLDRSIEAVREVLHEGGFETDSMDEMVFIGGPAHYEPLRRGVSASLGIRSAMDADPMTAVAVGAAIFAESVDWSTGSRDQTKRHRTQAEAGDVRYDLNYDKRVTTEDAKVRIAPVSGCAGATVEVISEQTGWHSGEFGLDSKVIVPLRVTQMGENTFAVVIKKGGQRLNRASGIRIRRSPSSVSAVPLTASIGIGVLSGNVRNERTKMLWLARRGDELPAYGSVDLLTTETLCAGDNRSINLKVYTGENDKPGENQAHGILRIKGADMNEGTLQEGATLKCEFQILEGGQLNLTVKAPDVRQEFRSDRNYYVHEEGAMDYRKAAGAIKEDSEKLREKVDEAQSYVDDKHLRRAQVLLDEIDSLSHRETDPETVKGAYDRSQEAKNLLATARKSHKSTLLQMEVEKERARWNEYAAPWAEEGVQSRVGKLFDAATIAAAAGDDECEDHLGDIRQEQWETLWNEDWYVVDFFKAVKGIVIQKNAGAEAVGLIEKGDMLLERGDVERLREVALNIVRLIQKADGATASLLESINIRSA